MHSTSMVMAGIALLACTQCSFATSVYWRHQQSGANYLYQFDASLHRQGSTLSSIQDQNWHLVYSGDFDGNGETDLLWQYANNAQYAIHFYANQTLSKVLRLPTVTDAQWQIQAVADLDGNHSDELIWRHQTSGANYVYQFSQQQRNGGYALGQIAPVWQLTTSGDFNGDGIDDLLWRHSESGALYLHQMHNKQLEAVHYVATLSDHRWQLAGIGDLNGDGHSDMVWRHTVTGENYAYFMHDGVRQQVSRINQISDLNWQLAGIADFNQDQNADLLWYNHTTGQGYLYLMQGAQIQQSLALFAQSDLQWHPVAVLPTPESSHSDIVDLTQSNLQVTVHNQNANALNLSFKQWQATIDQQGHFTATLPLQQLTHADPQISALLSDMLDTTSEAVLSGQLNIAPLTQLNIGEHYAQHVAAQLTYQTQTLTLDLWLQFIKTQQGFAVRFMKPVAIPLHQLSLLSAFNQRLQDQMQSLLHPIVWVDGLMQFNVEFN